MNWRKPGPAVLIQQNQEQSNHPSEPGDSSFVILPKFGAWLGFETATSPTDARTTFSTNQLDLIAVLYNPKWGHILYYIFMNHGHIGEPVV
jgi:hypothetical protein